MVLMVGDVLSAIFNGMPIIALKVVRLMPAISVSETVRSSAGSDPGEIMY